jgi:transcriptional regulator with XRE-family HTH domain
MGRMTERIRVLLVKSGNLSEAELARRMGITPQNLHGKFKRDNFTEDDLVKIAEVLGCTYKSVFILNTGEEI